MNENQNLLRRKRMITGIGMGITLGIVLGASMGNIALGLATGIIAGWLGVVIRQQKGA